MRIPLFLAVAFFAGSKFALAQATIEGRVELPRPPTAPVMTKRYEIVTKGGVLATNPPLAVVYLEGCLRKHGALPTRRCCKRK